MTMRWLILIILGWSFNIGYSQNQTRIWFFGDELGLDFRTSTPTVIDSKIVPNEIFDAESAAVASDDNGNLIFYTDGVTVWNKNHEKMLNGDGLLGSGTTSQTLIVPEPENINYYFIFTATPEGNDKYFPDNKGFHYSIVDITLNNGFGDIVAKNIKLTNSTTEKIAATLHANGTDIWVMMHEWSNNTFRCFRITKKGVEDPIINIIGSLHKEQRDIGGVLFDYDAIGQMKFSPDGTKLALALYESNIAEVFDFDPSEGTLSNPITLKNFEQDHTYGVEFSPNSKLLYIATPGYIFQYDLVAADISSSAIKVDEKLNLLVNFGQLQLAPDGKIYVARYFDFYLSVINNPNERGINCGFSQLGFSLDPENKKLQRSNLGLPNFISSYFYNPDLYAPNPYFEMPNVFTPNEDNFNSIFTPKKFYNIKEVELSIFNRWGQKVFFTINPKIGWNGEDLAEDTYYWIARFIGINDKKYVQKGFITLLR
jgi:gliding motility-associated-like protein